MDTFTEPATLTQESAAQADGRIALLDEVEFKWLLTGLGLWIDMSRFHLEPSYATHFLELAEASDSRALHDCAAVLRSQGASICQ